MVANPRQADLQAAKQSRYIPSYASGAARERQTSINQANVASGRTPAPTPRLPSSGGGGGSRDVPNVPAPAPSPAPQPRAPLNWRDAAYNAQIASIQRALADFETGATTRGERYGQDFTTGLQRLGYRAAPGFRAMPNVLEQLDQPQPMARALSAGAEGAPAVAVPPVSGGFDIEGEFDPYSAAARGTRSTRDEFAGRGTLRSSDFAKTFGEFQNRLNQQLEAMETSRSRFGRIWLLRLLSSVLSLRSGNRLLSGMR